MSSLLHAALLMAAWAVALALRPWQAVAWPGQPPWPWPALALSLPGLWSADVLTHAPLLQPPSMLPLLVLMAGWPLAVLALLPAMLVVAMVLPMGWEAALQRTVWLGLAPGTLALLLGLASRRWLPPQPFVFILVRGFLVTWVAVAACGAVALWLQPPGYLPQLGAGTVFVARFLAASGEAVLTGMVTAVAVAFRPQWLATWSDRRYLPPPV